MDPGFAALVGAIVGATLPFLVALIGFGLRNRWKRQRLAAALLEEVRIKLRSLLQSDKWLEKAEEMIKKGSIPGILSDFRSNVIFDNHHELLTLLPQSVLRRVTQFYKADDTLGIGIEEFRTKRFEEVDQARQLTHLANVRTSLLPRAILAGIMAELALTLACRLTGLEELSMKRRHSSWTSVHRRALGRARTTTLNRLMHFNRLPCASSVWPPSPRTPGGDGD